MVRCAFPLGRAELLLSATHGVRASVVSGNGQRIEANASVAFEVAVARDAGMAGQEALLAMDLDSEVLTDVPGAVKLRFADQDDAGGGDSTDPARVPGGVGLRRQPLGGADEPPTCWSALRRALGAEEHSSSGLEA